MQQKIGFIGLGIMGKPMAENLLRAGYSLSIYTRRPEVAESFTAKGATHYSSIAELAGNVDIIITIVTATSDVEEILIGKNGIITTAKPGCIVIDMSTISTEATRHFASKLQTKQIEMLDAPVSGGEQGAINASLTIMVGGKKDTLEKVVSILKTLGKQITHIGDHGAGQVAKACNQVIIAETIIAISEAFRLAKTSGIDPEKVREALLGGFASSRVLEIHGKRMLEKDYKPGFKAVLHRKDIHLALEHANHLHVDLPAANYAMHCLDRLVLKGYADLDSSAIHLLNKE